MVSLLAGSFGGMEESYLLLLESYAGDAGAAARLDRLAARLPGAGVTNGVGSWLVLLASVESAALLGRREQAAALYLLVRQSMAYGTVTPWCNGLVSCRMLAVLGQVNFFCGDFDRGDELLSEAAAMAEALGDESLLGSGVLLHRVYYYEHTVEPAKMVKVGQQVIELARRSGRPWDLSSALGITSLAWRFLGRFDRFRAVADEAEPLALQEGDLGTVAHVDRREHAAALYPLMRQLLAEGLVDFWGLGLAERVAGIAAAAGHAWRDAETHFESALRTAGEMPHRVEQPEVRRWYARMLLDRDGPGDRERARTLLAEARAAYEAIGMPKHVEMVDALLKDA